MRVLRIAHHAPVSAWRQRERELIAGGVDVTLVSSRRWNEGGRSVEFSADGDAFVETARTVGTHPNVFAYDPRPIWRLLGDPSLDLIDLHEEPCSLAVAEVLLLRWLRRSRAPYVMYSAQNIDKRYPIPFRWFERRALRGAAGAYVCNRAAGEILTRKGLRGPAVLIPLGVDVTRYSPADREPPTDEVVVGYVGRLEAHKGVATLLEAVAEHPPWRLQVIGDGPESAALAERVRRSSTQDRIRFHGHADQDALPGHYRGFDVLAVPSLPTPSWLEQFCRVAVEAMASGVPVVASRSGAIPDVVDEAGALVEPGDPDALSRAIADVTRPEHWTRRRADGLARAREFTWNEVARQHRAFYERVLGASAAPARPPQVLVVAYGSADLLRTCLEPLNGEFDVTVVDNSSSSETARIADKLGATYIDPGRNLGFAAGVNRGLRALADASLAGDDVLLLNPDAVIDPASIRVLQARLHASPDLACVGAAQTDPGSGAPARVSWPFPTPAGAWIEAVGLGRLRTRKDFVIGAVLLLRAEAIDDVGRLDERFFLYSEETDWQKRVRDRGWRVEAYADVTSTHVGAGTGGDPVRREQYFHASLERFIRKHDGAVGWQVFRAGMVVGAAIRALVLPGARGRAARRRRDLYIAGPIRVEGAAE